MQNCELEIPSLGVESCSIEATPFPKRLVVEDLGLKRSERWIFEKIQFEANPGDLIVLSGCSGAGKSSLLSILFGQNTPTKGRVFKQGLDQPGQIGMMYQDLCLCDELNAYDNILSGQLFRLKWWNVFGGFSDLQKNKAYELARALELENLLSKPVKYLSGGERQRVAVAKLLFQDSDLLLVDEPVSALDPKLASKVLMLLRLEAKKKSKIVICALHRRDLILDFADRIIEFS